MPCPGSGQAQTQALRQRRALLARRPNRAHYSGIRPRNATSGRQQPLDFEQFSPEKTAFQCSCGYTRYLIPAICSRMR